MSADDLARRLVAAPGFRWMPGMRLTNGYRLDDDGDMSAARDGDTYGWLPDLSDPATKGCLLRLAREAWAAAGWEGLELHTVGEGVAVVFVQHIERSGWQSFRAPTAGEALAHAILAAGEVRDA